MDKFIEAVQDLPPRLQDVAVECYHKLNEAGFDMVKIMDENRFFDCDYAFVVGMVVGFKTAKDNFKK